ncbi:MAG: DUF2723 domain-containing protein [bacterium]
MPLGPKRVRSLTAILLSLAVIVSRLLWISRMLYEFDSVDFAVATFRYSLEQVTPHFPGYILHILLARFILLFTTDVNLAFVSISVVLSIATTLFLWRAGAVLRGERVGVVAAVLWAFLPIFWFYGEISSVYIYESFFASVFLYLGFSIFRNSQRKELVYYLCIALSLAIGVRQSSSIFFTPAVIYLICKTHQPLRVWIKGLLAFVVLTASWAFVLFYYAGGMSAYFATGSAETVFKSQSVLFGNSFNGQITVIGKVISYLGFAALPIVCIFGWSLLSKWKRTVEFISDSIRKTSALYSMIVALPALCFYLAIYFMKAGYLLNILPTLTLAGAVMVDQLAIWRAEKIKRASTNKLLLTRPIITFGAIRNTLVIVALECVIFLSSFPWTGEEHFNNSFTQDSFNAGVIRSQSLFLNRFASFTNMHSVMATDRLHQDVLEALNKESKSGDDLILLDTWWHRWVYYYLPNVTDYDIRDFPNSDSLWVGKSQHFVRSGIQERVIRIPNKKKVLLLLRNDHPAFMEISKQVHLERLLLPKYLDIYRITDEHFSFHWKNMHFIKE